jgi:mycothiol system anti-sigma-R factor
MSGAEDEGFDCSLARLQLFEYLDGEIDLDHGARIRDHLAHCAPCLEEYDIDRIIKTMVRRSCSCEVAPAELRTQIMSRITTITMTVDLQD